MDALPADRSGFLTQRTLGAGVFCGKVPLSETFMAICDRKGKRPPRPRRGLFRNCFLYVSRTRGRRLLIHSGIFLSICCTVFASRCSAYWCLREKSVAKVDGLSLVGTLVVTTWSSSLMHHAHCWLAGLSITLSDSNIVLERPCSCSPGDLHGSKSSSRLKGNFASPSFLPSFPEMTAMLTNQPGIYWKTASPCHYQRRHLYGHQHMHKVWHKFGNGDRRSPCTDWIINVQQQDVQ
jgi:hypothetical protein